MKGVRYMKKLILSLLVGFGLVLVPIASASAASAYTDVTGTINYNGAPVGKGVKVIVKCNGNKLTDTTSKKGAYFVQFTKKECPASAKITVSATYGGITGSSKGKATKESNDLNVAIVNVSLPELGFVTSIGAVLLGGGAFFLIRQRNLRAKT